MRRAALLSLIVVSTLRLHGQAYEKRMEKGSRADLLGKTILAARQFEAAIAASKTPSERNEARFAYISAIAGSQPASELPDKVAGDVASTYEAILAEAVGFQSFKAHNDYGVFLLALAKPRKAVEVFVEGEKDLTSVEPRTQARYLYNFAEAHFDAGDLDAALATTRRVIELDPALEQAATKACKIIENLPKDRCAAETASIAELLLDRNQDEGAREWLWKAFDPRHLEWFDNPAGMNELIALCARWAAGSNIDYGEFTGKWLPRLAAAADGLSLETEQKVEQLSLVFKGEGLPLSFERDPEAIFSRWATSGEQKSLSRLAMIAAAALAEAGDANGAAERYIAAWRLDPSNIDALIYLVSITGEWEEAPEDLIDRLMAAAFPENRRLTEDADALLRLHLVLGSYFEQQDQWGPRDVPATAAYQYERALEQYARIFDGTSATVFPGVHANLAGAYERVGMKAEAWEQYLFAAEGSLSQELPGAAMQMLEAAQQLDYQPSREEAERSKRVFTALSVADAEPEAPTDAQITEDVRARLWAHQELAAEDLFVLVSNGVVQLSGTLNDRGLIEEAMVAAQAAAGVKDVAMQVQTTAEVPPPDH